MAFTINTNVSSLQAQENLRLTSDMQAKTINRVTSGLRIINSGDDAAGLAIANGYRSDVSVLTQGVRNANDGLSQLQIIDGGMNNISKLLDRARTLATQSASGTFTGDRNVLNSEFQTVIQEIDRQAQAIGLNAGGIFAKNLSVFVGGGKASGGTSEIMNGSVGVDLSSATVDSQSLGLSGVRAGGKLGMDLSTSSTTSVQNILGNVTNKNSEAVAGFTDFFFRGPGFADTDRVKVSVNLSGATDTASLVSAINTAIETAGNAGSASATAFKNSNIKAVVVTDQQSDGTVKERIAFVSANAAFQVEAGDRMSNALLGNFSSGATGKSLTTNFVAGSTVTGTSALAGKVVVRIQGDGLAGSKDIVLDRSSGETAANLAQELKDAIDNDADLKAAGITMNAVSASDPLSFHSSLGGRIDVQVAGDTENLLGMGTFRLETVSATAFDYTSISGAATTGATAVGAAQTFEFSLSGGSKVSITATVSDSSATGVVNALNAALAGNATLAAAGFRATQSGGTMTITNTSGTAFRLNVLQTVASSGNVFGFGSTGAGQTGVAFGGNYADAIYGTVSSATADLSTTNNVIAFSINGGATVSGTITTGAGVAIATIATDISNLLGTNGTANVVDNRIVITADNATTKIAMQSASNSIYSTLGIDSDATNYADSNRVNSGGAYATGVGDTKEVFSFSALRTGNADQTITISALDASGAQHSLSVVLQNDATARNAQFLDQAIETINEKLQMSADPTLKQIVAVKDQSANGGEAGIRFLSTVPDFRVSLGASADSTASAEVGIYDGTVGTTAAPQLGQGVINSATQSEGGSQLDITSLAGAQAAVSALASAVSTLGSAQAVVGRGQNQFNYAVNLAQSQLSNLAAAESRIRDADLAAEAANLSKAQVGIQAGMAALAQANSAPQAVLSLLKG